MTQLPYFPSVDDLKTAQHRFLEKEPRHLLYLASAELVELAWQRQTALGLAGALTVLLLTWNKAYYQQRRFDSVHVRQIEELLSASRQAISLLRPRSIDSYGEGDYAAIEALFQAFENVLGPVGAAKSLHLLAPRFFPIWDRKIAAAYGLRLVSEISNGMAYTTFMEITQAQCEHLGGEQGVGRNPLKAIDEFNFCRYTKRWL